MAELKEFEGKEVTEVGIEIRGVAGGLQKAVKFAPVEWEQGSEHFIVIRTLVRDVTHEPVEKDDFAGNQRRVHILTSPDAFPIPSAVVEEYVTTQRERIKKLKEEAEGVQHLNLGDEDVDLGGDDE